MRQPLACVHHAASIERQSPQPCPGRRRPSCTAKEQGALAQPAHSHNTIHAQATLHWSAIGVCKASCRHPLRTRCERQRKGDGQEGQGDEHRSRLRTPSNPSDFNRTPSIALLQSRFVNCTPSTALLQSRFFSASDLCLVASGCGARRPRRRWHSQALAPLLTPSGSHYFSPSLSDSSCLWLAQSWGSASLAHPRSLTLRRLLIISAEGRRFGVNSADRRLSAVRNGEPLAEIRLELPLR